MKWGKGRKALSWSRLITIIGLVFVWFATTGAPCDDDDNNKGDPGTKEVKTHVCYISLEVEYLKIDGVQIEMPPESEIFQTFNTEFAVDVCKWTQQIKGEAYTCWYQLSKLEGIGDAPEIGPGDLPYTNEYFTIGENGDFEDLALNHFDYDGKPEQAKGIVVFVHNLRHPDYPEQPIGGCHRHYNGAPGYEQQSYIGVAVNHLYDEYHDDEADFTDPWAKAVDAVTTHETGHAFLVAWNDSPDHHCTDCATCVMVPKMSKDPVSGYPHGGFCSSCKVDINNILYPCVHPE